MSDYLVRGADGADYPATLESIRAWIREGRIAPSQYAYDPRAGTWLTIEQLLAAAPPPAQYVVQSDDGAYLPADLATMRMWAAQQRLGPQQLVWEPRAQQWLPAVQVLGVDAFRAAPPPQSRRTKAVLLMAAMAVLFAVLVLQTAGRLFNDDAPAKKTVAKKARAAEAEPATRVLPLGQWVNDGPYGGPIERVLFSPADAEVALAAAAHSVFRTTDGGASWKRVLLTNLADFKAIRFSADGSRAFAAGKQLFVSADAGATWQQIETKPMTDLVVMNDAVFAVTEEGVVTSTDAGRTWSARGAPAGASTPKLAAGTNRLYARAENTLFESTDGARTWRKLPYAGGSIAGLAVVAPSTLYATTNEGLQRSTDSGATWSAIPKFAATKLYGVRTAGEKVVVVQSDEGWFRSDDAGENWSALEKPEGAPIGDVDVSPRDPERFLIAAQDDRLYRGDGEEWTDASNGLAAASVGHIAITADGVVAAQSTTDLFVASRGGAWRSARHTSRRSVAETFVSVFAGREQLYAIRGMTSPHVERSTDGGKTWSIWGEAGTSAVAEHPTVANRVYASTAEGLRVSHDGGESWETLAKAVAFQELHFAAGAMYLRNGMELKVSRDEGKTWTRAMDAGDARDLEVTSAGRVCAVTQDGVACLRGTAVERPNEGLPENPVTCIAAHPKNPNILLAGSEHFGVSVTRDGGATWKPFGAAGGPLHITQIVFDPGDASIVHVATAGESVYSIRTKWE